MGIRIVSAISTWPFPTLFLRSTFPAMFTHIWVMVSEKNLSIQPWESELSGQLQFLENLVHKLEWEK
jgi:hypothetical protein